MILLYKEDYGCVFSIDENDTLLYAPVYKDNTISLDEFNEVLPDSIDMRDMELFDIRNQLVECSRI